MSPKTWSLILSEQQDSTTTKTFSRFKYAEEFAQHLHANGYYFTMTNRFNVEHEEDGEVYVYDEFVVEW